MKKLGIETVNTPQGKQYAVVDYTQKQTVFSKVLTLKELTVYQDTGKLPAEVTETAEYVTVELFKHYAAAKKFVNSNGRRKKQAETGIFRSAAQARAARKLCSK